MKYLFYFRELIWQALKHYLENRNAEKLKTALEDGYKTNFDSDRVLNAEWESASFGKANARNR